MFPGDFFTIMIYARVAVMVHHSVLWLNWNRVAGWGSVW